MYSSVFSVLSLKSTHSQYPEYTHLKLYFVPRSLKTNDQCQESLGVEKDTDSSFSVKATLPKRIDQNHPSTVKVFSSDSVLTRNVLLPFQ